MTEEELERIQRACHEWLRQPGTSNGSRMTIPAGGVLSRNVEVEVRSLLTFDNVMIASAIDSETNACYSKLIAKQGGPGEFVDTPLSNIPRSSTLASQTKSAPPRATQKRYQDAMERLAGTPPSDTKAQFPPASEPNAWWIERGNSEADQQPKYLLYTDGKLLGYSLLEREGSHGQRSGRFHPSEDYFDYSEVLAALPQAENDCFEANAEEGYGIFNPGNEDYRTRFAQLSGQVDRLKLYVETESGRRIMTSKVELQDLSRHYDDQTERWLVINFEPEPGRD
jgi:hypothetical protein